MSTRMRQAVSIHSGAARRFGFGSLASVSRLHLVQLLLKASTLVATFALAMSVNAQMTLPAAGIINTVAGAGSFAGDSGAATSARINFPTSVAIDASGNIYIADFYNNRVRKVTISTGVITTVAGDAAGGYAGDGGAATSAKLEQPAGIALDSSGNIYIADAGNDRIRKVTVSTGVITTIAGNGVSGYSGDGGAATSAKFDFPLGVALDSAGNVYVADAENSRVRKLTASTGKISTVAGNGTYGYAGNSGAATSAELAYPSAVAVDSSGNIYVADEDNNCVRKVTVSSGVITTVAGTTTAGYSGDGSAAINAELDQPSAVFITSSGNLYIADAQNNRIRKVVISTGIITTVAGNGAYTFSGDGGQAASASLEYPVGVALDSSSNIYIADSDNNRIRKVVSSGLISTVAGSTSYGGDGKAAKSGLLNDPASAITDSSGNLYIADTYNQAIRKVTASTGNIATIAGTGIAGFSGDTGAATSALLHDPNGIALDSSGNVYIADSTNNRIRKVTVSNGIITTVAGNGSAGYTGDGGAATSAALAYPSGIAVDSANNLYIADQDNHVIRKVTAANGLITTIAGNNVEGYSGDGGPATSAEFAYPSAVIVDSSGNVYVADSENNRIRKVAASNGLITSVAGSGTAGYSGDGGAATSAMLSHPQGLAIDYGGNLYIADTDNSRLRKIALSTTGVITSVVGIATPGYYGDTLAASGAELFFPQGIALDSSANLYVVDTIDDRIRAVGKPAKTTPSITWPTPAAIAYGTALSATQLDATTSIAGTFVYTPPLNTVPALGSNTLSVQFTPTDSVDYATATQTTTLTVNKATPTITWPTPAPISYGTALSSTQLSATASVPGTFVYSPASGAVLAPGAQTLSVTFTPTNTTDYNTSTGSTILTVNKAATFVTWTTPQAIKAGTSLSSTQLNATASVPGTFVYSPASGSIPAVGSDTLSVAFTPTNSTDYATASGSVVINVLSTPTIASINPSFGTPGTPISIGGSGFGISQGSSTVSFNGVAGSPTAWSDSTITVPVPASATNGKIVVATVGGTATTTGNFPIGAPSITGLSLSQGPVGMGLVITGTNFGSSTDTLSVGLGNTVMTIVPGTSTSTSITVQVPTGASTGNITVSVDGAASNAVPFTVTPPFGCS